MSVSTWRTCVWVVVSLGMAAAAVPASAQVTIEQILKYKPVQPGVEYETPPPEEFSKCKIEVERSGKSSGWVVYGPAGQILRRFVDTDGDNTVDQWRYYLHGLEVYRDIDTNGNNEVDQSRWLNLAGTRWGIDANEDGKIDRWLRLSAEEASREAIHALAHRDERALAAVLIDAQDVRALGLKKEMADELLKAVTNPAQQMRDVLTRSKTITGGTKWVRFDSSMLMPNLIPRETGHADRDLVVYENVMAIVDNGGQTGFVQIGELVQVGDVWKLTSIPQPIEGEQLQVVVGGLLMQPSVAALTTGSVQLSPQVQKLVEQLQKLDEAAPGPMATAAEATRYNVARAKLLQDLAEAADSAEDRELWQRQLIDLLAAAVQMDCYPNGVAELEAVEKTLRSSSPQSELIPYARFQRLYADYNIRLRSAEGEERAKVQEAWVQSLEQFLKDYPRTEEAADALLQLAVSHEFAGKVDLAVQRYEQLVREHGESPAARRGTGALRRLKQVGSSLNLAGKGLSGGTIDVRAYRGKVLAVVFWATWCKPCTEELPQLIELYRQHRAAGFEVLGVNLDSPGAPVQQYLQEHKVPWPHIAEEGGLESRPAQEFGIITLPTMFLVDKQGNVVSSGASLEELKTKVPELLKP